MKKTNILLISPPFRPNVGGVETHLDDLLKDGVSKNIFFHVVTYQPLITNAQGERIEKGSNFVIYRVPWLRAGLFLKLEKYPALEFIYLFPGIFVASLYVLLKNKKIDVIHAQGIVAGTISVFLKKVFKIKNIISTHSIYNFPETGFYHSFMKFIFANCDHILTLSKQSELEILKLGIKQSKISVFRYWVDQEIFKPKSKTLTRKKLNLNSKDFICLYVGRLVEVKGVMELIKAAIKIKEKDFKLLIVGDGPLAKEINTYSKNNNNLIFKGRIDNSQLKLYYNAADVLVVPSVHEEGFGRVILESLSCGTPVIGSNRGAIPEAMDDSVGYLVNVSINNLYKSLIHVYRNRTELNSKSKNAYKYAIKKFGNKNSAMITNYYYEK